MFKNTTIKHFALKTPSTIAVLFYLFLLSTTAGGKRNSSNLDIVLSLNFLLPFLCNPLNPTTQTCLIRGYANNFMTSPAISILFKIKHQDVTIHPRQYKEILARLTEDKSPYMACQ